MPIEPKRGLPCQLLLRSSVSPSAIAAALGPRRLLLVLLLLLLLHSITSASSISVAAGSRAVSVVGPAIALFGECFVDKLLEIEVAAASPRPLGGGGVLRKDRRAHIARSSTAGAAVVVQHPIAGHALFEPLPHQGPASELGCLLDGAGKPRCMLRLRTGTEQVLLFRQLPGRLLLLGA